MKMKDLLKTWFILAVVAFVACGSFAAEPEVPDLTNGGVKDDYHDWTLGPTGARGWIWGWELQTTSARQILITEVASGSPADGVLQVDDVIVGVNGSNFTSDARIALGKAITEAEKTENNGNLNLRVWRSGSASNMTVQLEVMGSYSSTSPYSCTKYDQILDDGCAQIASNMGSGIVGAVNGLALLASGKSQYSNTVRDYAWQSGVGKDVSLTIATDQGLKAWYWGYNNLFLTEYYLATGDSQVLAAITEYSTKIAEGQSIVGTWGHGMAWLDQNDGEMHGTLGGYGAVNQASLVCHISLVLAKKCGVNNSEVDAAIAKSNEFLSFYINKGSMPYGDHTPWKGHDNNGVNSSVSVSFDLQGMDAGAEYFSKMVVASYGEREIGHTGNFFSYLWGPLGANRSGAEAAAAFMKEQQWFYDLARRWDGKFTYQGGAARSGGEHSYNNWDCTGEFILPATLPLKKLYITGKEMDTSDDLNTAEVAEAIEAGRGYMFWDDGSDHYEAKPDSELLTCLGNWSPTVRLRAAKALGAKGSDVIDDLITMLSDSDINVRYGACDAIAEVSNNASATDELMGLLDHDDYWLRIKACYALAGIGASAKSVAVPRMLEMALEFDPGDPRQYIQRYMAFLLFSNDLGVSGFIKDDLTGVDVDRLIPAMRQMLKNDDGRSRSRVSDIYDELTIGQLGPILQDIYDSIETMSPSGVMFANGSRINGLKVLASNKVQEGLLLGIDMLDLTRWGKQERVAGYITCLNIYGADANKTILTQLKSLKTTLENHWEAESMEASITSLGTIITAAEAASGDAGLVPLASLIPAYEDILSINFYDGTDNPASQNTTIEAGQSAGFGAFQTTGWENYGVSWSPAAGSQSPVTVTSVNGNAATFRLTDVRNGDGTQSDKGVRSLAAGDGNGDLMDATGWGTEDPGDQSEIFDITVSDILYEMYDVIVYLGYNSQHGGDGTGTIVFNGSSREFKTELFTDTFRETFDNDTPGNCIVFKNVTERSFSLQVFGDGLNHVGVSGIQVASYSLPDVSAPTPDPMTWASVPTQAPAGISYMQVMDDVDSAISTSNVYTHAIDFGSNGTATVNGVVFANDMNVSAGGRSNLGTRTYGVSIGANNTPPNVSGDVAIVYNDMVWGGPDNGYVELTGLTDGQWYKVQLFERAWSYQTTERTFYASYDVGSDADSGGLVEYTTPKINQSDPTLTPPGLSGNVCYVMSYIYQADSNGKIKITIDLADGWTGTYHLYGLTNQEITPSATMTATTAIDSVTEVEYYFEETSGNSGGDDSGWQDSPVYVDSDLVIGLEYKYKVKARDKSINLNETGFSQVASVAIEAAPDVFPPTPNPAGFAVGPTADDHTSISMTAIIGDDDNGPVEYLFTETSGNAGGTSSDWQESAEYTDTDLSGLTEYKYTVTMRDAEGNVGDACAEVSVSTPAAPDVEAPTPSPMTWVKEPVVPFGDPLGILSAATLAGDNPATTQPWEAGDTYRLVFVTSTMRDASSNDIADYNAFVQSVADGSSLGLDRASWKVIGSTETVDAIDNTSTNGIGGEAIFLLDGSTVVANGNTDLWDDFLDAAINIDENGVTVGALNVATGSTGSGTKDDRHLGGSDEADPRVQHGRTGETSVKWISVYHETPTKDLVYYALSDPITLSDFGDPQTEIFMEASVASDASGVEYYFDETSGNPGGDDSGWQDSPVYIDIELVPGMQYTYTVTARDKSDAGNETLASTAVSVNTYSDCSGTCGDIDGSGGAVDLGDFTELARCWGKDPFVDSSCGCANLVEVNDKVIDLQDLAVLAELFMSESMFSPPYCK